MRRFQTVYGLRIRGLCETPTVASVSATSPGPKKEMPVNDLICQAVDILGSNNALAEKLGVHPSLVSNWKTGRRTVAPVHCKAIQRLTKGKVKAKDLRPDVFC